MKLFQHLRRQGTSLTFHAICLSPTPKQYLVVRADCALVSKSISSQSFGGLTCKERFVRIRKACIRLFSIHQRFTSDRGCKIMVYFKISGLTFTQKEKQTHNHPQPFKKPITKHKLPPSNRCPYLSYLCSTTTSKLTWYPDKRPAVLRPDP